MMSRLGINRGGSQHLPHQLKMAPVDDMEAALLHRYHVAALVCGILYPMCVQVTDSDDDEKASKMEVQGVSVDPPLSISLCI